MHFAGLKAHGKFAEKPFDSYDNIVTGTLQLLAAMAKTSVKTNVCSHRIQLASVTLTIFHDTPLTLSAATSR